MGSGGWTLVAGGWLLAAILLWARPLTAQPQRALRKRRSVPSSGTLRCDSHD